MNLLLKQINAKRWDMLIGVILIVSIIAVYGQVKDFEFVHYDDEEYVVDNQHVRNGLSFHNIKWAFTAVHSSNWHPLTWVSHMIDVTLFGMDAGIHHLINVLFHIINTLLLFFIFRKMTGKLWQSAFIAIFFALHPLHVESVAWIAERKDVLSAFFWMLTILFYIRHVENPNGAGYSAALLCFMLGLMAKPMLVTMPFVLLLLDYWPLCRFDAGQTQCSREYRKMPAIRLILEKIPLFALSAMSAAVTYFVQRSWGAVASLNVYPLRIRLQNVILSYVEYIEKMILPNNMAVFYPYPREFSKTAVAVALILLVLICIITIITLRRFPYIGVGWLWYLGTLVPVIGIVQVGSQSMADRYTYLPLIGLFIILAWGAADLTLSKNIGQGVLVSIFLLMVIGLSGVSWIQTGYWQNSISLYQHALSVTKNNDYINFNLGVVLEQKGRIQEALRHYQAALEINPYLSDARINYGLILSAQGKTQEAIEQFKIELDSPKHRAGAYNNIGIALFRDNRYEDAAANFYKAIQFNPEYADARKNFRILILKLKNAVNENPDDTKLRAELEAILMKYPMLPE